jgi:hypothetical protein
MVKNNQMETGQARGGSGRVGRAGCPVGTLARSKHQTDFPAASRTEESADNSDDLKAIGWVSHERRKA